LPAAQQQQAVIPLGWTTAPAPLGYVYDLRDFAAIPHFARGASTLATVLGSRRLMILFAGHRLTGWSLSALAQVPVEVADHGWAHG
jgi:hypothetical protein